MTDWQIKIIEHIMTEEQIRTDAEQIGIEINVLTGLSCFERKYIL
jgi:hypothetical protein